MFAERVQLAYDITLAMGIAATIRHGVSGENMTVELPGGNLHPLKCQEANDDLLFHYTSRDSLVKILSSGTLRMGSYANTNDPREQKEWVPRFTMPVTKGRPAERYLGVTEDQDMNAVKATNWYLRRGARLACFTRDREAQANATPGALFHRGWARARMWEQYAAAHRGACLVFERQDLIQVVDDQIPHQDGDLFFYGNVNYVDQALEISLPWMEVVDNGIEVALDDFQVRREAAQHLYMTKNTDWASEQEFRVVCVRWDVPEPEVDEPIFIEYCSALKWIILGENAAGHEDSELRGLIPDAIQVLRCEWHSGVPVLT